MLLSPGTRLGPYEILSAIGAGGMGEVYRARDTRLKRDVALKILPESLAADPDRLARFQREAEVLASLNHPNIAHIHGLEDAEGIRALVMEMVEGPTLADRIARGPIPIDELLPIAKQIAEALEAAHEQGIIHRDLKPANIKVREDGTVKVLDFGLAKAMDPTASSAANVTMSPTLSMHATMAGLILGTAAYMSPEQARGGTVDRRADIWALGVVLFEMLTGRRAFDGDTISDTLASVLKTEPQWSALPPDTPAPIRRLLRRSLEKDRKRRLESVSDARLEIEDALTAPAGEASPVGVPRRRGTWPIVFAVAGSALAAALATWALIRPALPPTTAPLIRLSVDLGPDAVAGRAITVAISPDGSRIVFPIRSASGTPQLATRLLDQATPTPLPSTENGLDPFFSPDGQWIAFVADGKLKKISVLGGAAITLCDATAPRGGSWGEDGSIIAALLPNVGLSRIPAAGGTPQPFTRLVNGEQSHRWPQILPGGQHVLFTASTDTGSLEDATVQVLSVKTGQVKTIAQGGYFGRYLSGAVIYLHQGVLFAVPFDLATLEARGAPAPLLDDVASDPLGGGGQLDFSRNGTFVYRSGKGASQAFPVVWLDRSGTTQPLLPKPGVYLMPHVSPEGQRLALAMDVGKGQDIYVYEMQRDAMSRLTFNGHENLWPVWTPDGKHIVYSSLTDKTIMWIRADGAGEAQRLLESKNELRSWSFSPDGRYLSYSENVGGAFDSWILPVDSSDPEHPKPGKAEVFLNTPALEAAAVFSPDGRWAAYTSDESGKPEVYVRPFHNSAGGKWLVSTGGGVYSFWSRDGRELYYEAPDRRIMVVDYTANGDSFTAGKPRVWSETQVRPTVPGYQALDLAPDGTRFAVLPSDVVVEEKGSVHATFLLNFFDELHRRLP